MYNNKIYFNNYSSGLFQLIVGITFLIFFTNHLQAQVSDTATVAKKIVSVDSIKVIDTVVKIKKYHSPKKAAIYSTILPGLGQVYNKKYWKVPFIYAAAAGLTYSLEFNQSHYVKYRNAYKDRLNGVPDPYLGIYTDDNLNTLFVYYHRYRDLSVIGFAALYVLNILDATVDAHLFNFDVSDNLSFNVHPTLINTTAINHYATGLSLNIKF